LLFALAGLGWAAEQSREYQVVLVTPHAETDGLPGIVRIPPGPLILRGVTLKELISRAYGQTSLPVIGGPGWMNTDRWNFRLDIEPPIMDNKQYEQLMLKALEDRFALKLHQEKKVVPVYAVRATSTGSTLVSDPYLVAADPGKRFENGSIRLRNISLETFANLLSQFLDWPVVDRTDIPGLFRVALDWSPGSRDSGDIFQAVQKQLGLVLVPGDDLVQVAIIDRVQKPRVD
jgi:uncharacterized protein (TIGR03435 family)